MEITVKLTASQELLEVLNNLFSPMQPLFKTNITLDQRQPAIAPISEQSTVEFTAAPPAEQTKPEVVEQTSTFPTVNIQYTADDLALAGSWCVDNHKGPEVAKALQEIAGVNKLTDLPQDKYGEFAMRLQALGAKL